MLFKSVKTTLDNLRRLLQVNMVLWRWIILPHFFPSMGKNQSEPVRVRLALEELGGSWIKLGQMLALRFDLLSPDYCYEFFKLLNEVKPFPYAQVREIIKEDLGDYPEVLFRSFDHEVMAAASIGQVHRAVLHSGQAVAVKVQRPNIKRILQNDIALMYFAARILDHTRIFGGTRSGDVVEEFSRWTEEEMDYVVEARHARLLRENACGDKLQKDADVFLDLTSSRVLTMELIKGIPLIDIFSARQQNNLEYLRSLEERGYDLQLIARHISWNALNQVYRQGYFHGDLHPANLFVLPDNVIAYVDYGIVGTLDPEVRESLVHYAWNLFQGDTSRAVVQFMRWITPTDRTDVDAARDELVAVMNDFILTTRSKANHSNKESYSVFEVKLMNTVRNHQMRLSHKLVSYFKAAVTLSAVVYQLAPDFDIAWHENLFFGRMAVQDIREWTNPRHFSRTAFDYAFRLRQMFVGMEGLGKVGQTVQTMLLKIRRRMLSLGGLALVVGIALYASFTKPGSRFLSSIIGDRAQYLPEILLGIFVLLIIGVMHQGQRLFRERRTMVNEDAAWQERWRRGPMG